MRFITFEHMGRRSFGVLTDRGVVDIPSIWPAGPMTLLQALEQGSETLARIAKLVEVEPARIPADNVRLLAPLPAPPKIIGLAVNYVEHHNEFDRAPLPDDPKYTTTPRPFLMPATCVAGPGDTIAWPSYSRQIDHEVELAVVIGQRCHNTTVQQARECIAGYTIANDISARSCTHADGRQKRPKDDFFDWLHGKWADGFCPLGPYIVTADEIGDPMKLHIELAVNGEVRQSATTGAMIHDVYETVSFISHIMTLVPGDVIATGTPSGVGMATGKWLAPGDVMTCRIEKIGELTNTIGRPPAEFYQPCVRG